MTEREIITLEFNHPVAVALRRQMKGDFIDAISSIPASESTLNPNAKLVLFGSTLMHQLHYIDNIEFPFSGARVSDIDIAVWKQDNSYGDWNRGLYNDFRAEFMKHVPPLLKQALLNAGFNYAQEDKYGNRTEKWDRDEIIRLPEREYFGKPFEAYRVFNGNDMLHRLSFRKDFDILKELIQDDPRLWDKQHQCIKSNVDVKVSLTISPHALPFRMVLDPEPLYPGADHPQDGRISIYRANRLDLLAQKIGRILAEPHSAKAGDFLDIYNICNAEPPILNLNNTDSQSDLNTLRLLAVTYLADQGVREPYRDGIDLLKPFEPSAQNVNRFLGKLSQEVPAYRMRDIEKKASAIFETARSLVTCIFAKRSEKSFGLLHYTPEEVHFTAAIFGDKPDLQNMAQFPVSRSGWSLAKLYKKPTPTVNQPAPADCRIDVDPLIAQYGALAIRLAPAIRQDPWLTGQVEDARERCLKIHGSSE